MKVTKTKRGKPKMTNHHSENSQTERVMVNAIVHAFSDPNFKAEDLRLLSAVAMKLIRYGSLNEESKDTLSAMIESSTL